MVTVVSKVKTKRVNHTRPQLFLSNPKARDSADSAPLATPVPLGAARGPFPTPSYTPLTFPL